MNKIMSIITSLLLTLFIASKSSLALKKGDCEVCVNVLNKIEKSIKESKIEDPAGIEKELMSVCKHLKGKENRFCYYIGATDDAATKIVHFITKPLAYHKPVEKICENLNSKDSQICSLAYDKDIDWNNINLKKLKVRELKNILSKWDESCEGCLEKPDFVKRIEELKPKYVRDTPKAEL